MYASVNSLAHKFNMYPLLQNIVYFTNSTFVKKTHYPIISICLFIIAVVLNSIQYHKNNNTYLQDKIIVSNKDYPNGTSKINNSILYLYEFISINGFIDNTPAHIFLLIVTYFCLSLIEMNIGYLALIFLLFIDIMFQFSWVQYHAAICTNNLESKNILLNSPYCCGSLVFFMALGFVLFLIQYNINNIWYRMFIIFIMLSTWAGCIIYDYILISSSPNDKGQRTCKIFTWHATNFVFGICCGFALGNY